MKLPNILPADYNSAVYTLLDNNTANTCSIGRAYPNVVYTSDMSSSPFAPTTVTINSNGIEMKPGADIVIGGRSLIETLDAINQRLAILQPNTRLESEWAELKELGERYRAMEQDLLEKARAWDILKAPAKR